MGRFEIVIGNSKKKKILNTLKYILNNKATHVYKILKLGFEDGISSFSIEIYFNIKHKISYIKTKLFLTVPSEIHSLYNMYM